MSTKKKQSKGKGKVPVEKKSISRKRKDDEKSEEEKKKVQKNRSPDFNRLQLKTYIKILQKEQNSEVAITSSSVVCINNIIKTFLKKLCGRVDELTRNKRVKTVNDVMVRESCMLYLPGKLATQAIAEIDKTMSTVSSKKKGSSPQLRSVSAGLNFPVTRLENSAMSLIHPKRRRPSFGFSITSVLEFLATKILEASIEVCLENRASRITCSHISIAISKDPDLSELSKNMVFSGILFDPQLGSKSELYIPKKLM